MANPPLSKGLAPPHKDPLRTSSDNWVPKTRALLVVERETKQKCNFSRSNSRGNPIKNAKEDKVTEMVRAIVKVMESERSRARTKHGNNGSSRICSRSSSKATQQKNPSQTRSKSNSRGAKSSAYKTDHTERVFDYKIIIVGNSDLAIQIAARLDAELVSAVTDTGTLENFKGKMAAEYGLVKVVFIDSWTEPLDFNATPDEVVTYLISAAKDVLEKFTKDHNHLNSHCELVYFHPMESSQRSHMKEHLLRKHPEVPLPETATQVAERFEVKIVEKYCSSLSRQIGEAIHIRGVKGELLNDREEFNRCELPMLCTTKPKRKPIETERDREIGEETEKIVKGWTEKYTPYLKTQPRAM